MTVSSEAKRNIYTGNNSTTVFAFNFRIKTADEILVKVDGVAQSSGFTVSGAGSDADGSVTFSTPPANGAKIELLPAPDFTQELNYEELKRFPAEGHEEGLDRSVIRDLAIMEEVSRALKVPTADPETNVTLPAPQANHVLYWNSSGTALTSAELGSISSTIDTAIASPQNGDLLQYNGAAWANVANPTVVFADGTGAAPSVAIGEAGTGFSQPASGLIELSFAGSKYARMGSDAYGNFYLNGPNLSGQAIAIDATNRVMIGGVPYYKPGSLFANSDIYTAGNLSSMPLTVRYGNDLSVSSITRSGATATVTANAHGLSNGHTVFIQGADQSEYNGQFDIANVTTNTFDITVSGTPATPATGTIECRNVNIYDPNGCVNIGRQASAQDLALIRFYRQTAAANLVQDAEKVRIGLTADDSGALFAGATNTPALVWNDSGDVAIGADDPTVDFEVVRNGDSSHTLQIENKGSGGSAAANIRAICNTTNVALQATDGTARVGTTSSHALSIIAGDSTAATVNTDGNIGIGVSAISATRFGVVGAGSTGATNAAVIRNSSGTDLLILSDSGDDNRMPPVYANSTGSAANVFVESNGQLRRSTSGRKYKENIQDYTKGLDTIDGLKPVSFTSKGDNSGKVFAGFVAEDIHDLGLSEFVVYDAEGEPDALHYANMVALLVNCIKELKAEINNLKEGV